MRIERHNGCVISDSIFVDGTHLDGIENKRYIIERLLAIIKNNAREEHITISQLLNLIQETDNKVSETCDQCGDSVYTEIWEI